MDANTKGTKEVTKALKAELEKHKGPPIEYEVGYTANYAAAVHENLKANFKRPGARAKFLETPSRQLSKVFTKQLTKMLNKGFSLDQALNVMALKLQRDSQAIVPVDTGNLRGTAFTRKVK